VGRISGSPLHLSLHLRSRQLENCSVSQCAEMSAYRQREIQVWSLPLPSVRFRKAAGSGSACYSQAASCADERTKARACGKFPAKFGGFPVHINPSLWIKVEKLGEINLTGITATPPCCKSGAKKLCKTIMYKKRPSAVRLALVSPLRGSSIQFALTQALRPGLNNFALRRLRRRVCSAAFQGYIDFVLLVSADSIPEVQRSRSLVLAETYGSL